MTMHEKKISKEIKEAKDSGQKMWCMINKLSWNNPKEEKEVAVYDEVGNKINWDTLPEKMAEYWNTIYRKHPNEIHVEWNEQIKKRI